MDNFSFSDLVAYVQLNDMLLKDAQEQIVKNATLFKEGKIDEQERDAVFRKASEYIDKKNFAMELLRSNRVYNDLESNYNSARNNVKPDVYLK